MSSRRLSDSPDEASLEPDFEALDREASRVFTPAKPIAERELFAGRMQQVRSIVDAINQDAQHVVLYGERGVGKTSLANVLQRFLSGHTFVIAPRVNCGSIDTYSTMWRRMFDQIVLTSTEARAGLRGGRSHTIKSLASDIPDQITVDHVQKTMAQLGRQAKVVLIFDEFDTVRRSDTRRGVAETIKVFSDFDVPATIVLVGVADSVGDLLKEHRSVERAIVQVQMPRMSDAELKQILVTGMRKMGLTMDQQAITRITHLSKGLPHYTHLLGLYSTRAALEERSVTVHTDHVDQAIEVALENAHTMIEAYEAAVYSAHKKHLYRDVLLACALAKTDPIGWFAPSAVRKPLNEILPARNYDVPAYVRHLNDFTTETRRKLLQKSGVARKFRFRFDNPLMQPFVILRGYADKKIHWPVDGSISEDNET